MPQEAAEADAPQASGAIEYPTADEHAALMPPEHPGNEVESEAPAEHPEATPRKQPRMGERAAYFLKEIETELADQKQRGAIFASWWLDQQPKQVVEIDLGQVELDKFTKKGNLYVSKKLQSSPEVSWKTLDDSEKKLFEGAMTRELDQVLQAQALRAARASEISGPEENDITQMRWLLTWKKMPDAGSSTRRAKARLIILGFQHPRLTELTTAAPTVSRLGKHISFCAIALHGFDVEAADASSAFLQAEESLESQNLFVRPTAEVAAALGLPQRQHNTVVKVLKSFYGLTNGGPLCV